MGCNNEEKQGEKQVQRTQVQGVPQGILGRIQRAEEMEVHPMYPWSETVYEGKTGPVHCPSFGHGRPSSSTPEGHRDFLDVQAVVLLVLPGHGEFSSVDLRGQTLAS